MKVFVSGATGSLGSAAHDCAAARELGWTPAPHLLSDKLATTGDF